jgi:hypothetical protein
MIREITMYVAECDRCGKQDNEGDYAAWAEADQAEDVATESGWEKISGRLVCFDCWTYSEDGTTVVEVPALATS